jgi:CHAT domain-containing protein
MATWRVKLGSIGLLVAAALSAQPSLPLNEPDKRIAGENAQRYLVHIPRDGVFRMVVEQNTPSEMTVRMAGVFELRSKNTLFFFSTQVTSGQYSVEIIGSGRHFLTNIESLSQETGRELLRADAQYSELQHTTAPAPAEQAAKLDEIAGLYSRNQEPESEAWTLLLAGQFWSRASDPKRAGERYEAAASIFRTTHAENGLARALYVLATTQAATRDFAKAIESANESLALARGLGLANIEAGSLRTLADAYSFRGDKQRALEYLPDALKIARSTGDRAGEAAALAALGSVHNTLGNYEKSIEFNEEALPIQRALGDRLAEAKSLNSIGGAYGCISQTGKALDYFLKSAAILRSTEGGRTSLAAVLSNGGQAYVSLKQPAKAVPLLVEAKDVLKELGNRWNEAYTLTILGSARRASNDFAGADAALSEALSMEDEIGDPQLEALTRYESARLERARGNLDEAARQAAATVAVLESVRNRVAAPDLRSSLLGSNSEYYELHVDVLMQIYRERGQQARLEEARRAAEQLRARNLLEAISAAGVGPAPAGDAELIARERKLHKDMGDLSKRRTALMRTRTSPAQIATINKQIDETWTEYQTVQAKLSAGDAHGIPAADPAAADSDTIRRDVLDAGTVLLEYFLGRDRSYLWVLSMDRLQGFELPAKPRIEEAALAFWNALKDGEDEATVAGAATRVSKLALAPALAALAGKRLLIVPDGALQFVPFQAIADPASTSYRPLIGGHEVIEEPSATTLALLRRAQETRKPAARQLALFADPVFEAGDPRMRRFVASSAPAATTTPAFLTRAAELSLARLPSTRQEARLIAALLPESVRWVSLDFEATRDAVISARLGDYRIIHFATHGVVDGARPELSALALSMFDESGNPRDGFLRLYEIYNLHLQADLVVLSSCQTALGKNVHSEGLVGLARGFMHAGAPRVVASLWKVNDQATSELMRLFYSAMLGPQKKSAASALRDAQLAMARQERWRSPYYWAAFVLQGEWK